MKKYGLLLIFTLILSAGAAEYISAGGPPAGNFWADGSVYKTVITPSKLPLEGPKDGLYVFSNLEGQNPVSETKPGDADYNGGRWQVYVLAFTDQGMAIHDADGNGVADFELTSWEMVQNHLGLGHLELVTLGPTFVCPLIP